MVKLSRYVSSINPFSLSRNNLKGFSLPGMCESDKELADKIQEAFDNDEEVMVTVVSSMEIDCVKSMRVNKSA